MNATHPRLNDYIIVVDGWNLVGVIDQELLSPGIPHSARLTFDDYLAGFTWRVAYGYSADTNTWEKFIPGGDDLIHNGVGYWVWTGEEPPPGGPPQFP